MIEHVFCIDYVSVFLIVAVNRAERVIESVFLVGSGLPSALVPGQRLTVKHTQKSWKKFESDFKYLSRGWDETLRLQQENASPVEHDTMTK